MGVHKKDTNELLTFYDARKSYLSIINRYILTNNCKD